MSNEQTRVARFERYEEQLRDQLRPMGPIQALRYHWLIPEQPPTFLELLYLPVIAVGLVLVVSHDSLPVGLSLLLAGFVVALCLATIVLWWLARTNLKHTEEQRGEGL